MRVRGGTISVSLRLSPDEKQLIRRALRSGETMSDFLRAMAVNEAKRRLVLRGLPVTMQVTGSEDIDWWYAA